VRCIAQSQAAETELNALLPQSSKAEAPSKRCEEMRVARLISLIPAYFPNSFRGV
jgi:hypothetical protein